MKDISITHLQFNMLCVFSRGVLRGVFLPLAGASGRQGFWAWACAHDSRNAVGGMRGGEGVARRGQKPLGRRQGRAFFPPFLWRSKERGRGGGGGAKPPRRGVGDPAFCVTIPQEGKAPYSCMRARLMRGLSFGIHDCFSQSRSTLAI